MFINHRSMDESIQPSSDSRPISVLIVDDHPLVSDALQNYLETDGNITVVGRCSRGEDVLEAVESLTPDVVIMDPVLDSSQVDGIEATRNIRLTRHHTQVLILSAFSDERFILEAIKAGAAGYLLKTSSRVEIIHAVRTVAAGQTIFDPRVTEILRLYLWDRSGRDQDSPPPSESSMSHLTQREWEVLELIAQDKSNREIGEILVISEKTVKVHVRNIREKLGVTDRGRAKLWYMLHGREHKR